MNNIELKIATAFSKTPGARYKEEGDFSGEEFRENVLFTWFKKALNSGCHLVIDLDGTTGLGTSFLEESFGGLIRTNHVNYRDIVDSIEFVSNENPDYIEEIKEYIKDSYDKSNKK